MRYTRPDGALVIVDLEREGLVYFRSWRGSQENPAWIKMPRPTFDEAIAKEGMRPEAEE